MAGAGRQRSAEHARLAQPHQRARPRLIQAGSQFRMSFDGEAVADAMADGSAGNELPLIAEQAAAIVAPHGARLDRIIAQAGSQHARIDIQGQHGRHAAPQGIARDEGGLPGAIDAGHLVQHERTAGHAGSILLHAIDVQAQ
ncbi:hypothetical protein D3C72_1110300 [compost metagenome]